MRTIKLFAVFLFLSGACFADTYIYRVTGRIKGADSAKSDAETIESKDRGQPFSRADILSAPDTNYYLLTVSPASGEDPQMEIISGIELYQVKYVDEDGHWKDKLDNSKAFPIDENWVIKKSS